jgi:hypothetical protein
MLVRAMVPMYVQLFYNDRAMVPMFKYYQCTMAKLAKDPYNMLFIDKIKKK